ncbi:MAG: hypothetical protein ACE145_10075 [Terriglobia bacterium]
MNPFMGLIGAWGLITGALIVLYVCRSRLEGKESDWIPLTDDAREDKAIQEQQVIEKKAHKFDWPIRVLGILSVVLALSIVGYFVYHGVTTPPPPPQ